MAKSKVTSEPGIKIDPEFSGLIPAASADELDRLKASIIADGCLDPLIVWDEENTLLDGHTRYGVCCEHEVPFTVKKLKFANRHVACNWVLNHQLGRRNISEESRRYLVGKLYIEQKANPAENLKKGLVFPTAQNELSGNLDTAKGIGEQHGMSAASVKRAGEFATAVDAIGDKSPELKAAIIAGDVQATNAEVQQVAKLSKKAVEKVAKAAKATKKIKDTLPKPKPKKDGAQIDKSSHKRSAEKGLGELVRAMHELGLYESHKPCLTAVQSSIRKA